uniref:Uncharacterized protein n=1 Tax=Candidatus Kentrum sp. TC TaxID=2126339 RepID=A0A451A412_9GAMM|nr:MAG: hypothetical protein BECKTC1821D_GA0114238_11983 [Candidatus Kentron sp. TC]VFK60789.1 MAG: hypothetical protein BECKTC1821F_GA0114240_10501 [Candidatus Kentron sp. TC]
MEPYDIEPLYSNNNVIVLTDEQGQMALRRRLPNDLCTAFSLDWPRFRNVG